MMASRVAAKLKKESGVLVEMVHGGLGEFSVYIDDKKMIDTKRFLYPVPGRIVKKIQALLTE